MRMSDMKDWELSLSLFRVEKEGSLTAEEVRAIKKLAEERKTPVSCRAFLAVLTGYQRTLEGR